MHYYLITLLLFFSCATLLSEENNNSDLEDNKYVFLKAALEKAKKNDKSVLLLFCSFQDKCNICKKLKEQIIKEPEFLSFTSKKVVFEKLDIDDLILEKRLQILQLARKFGLTQKGKPDKLNSKGLTDCYPVFVLLDEKGRLYSKFILNEITIVGLISNFEKSLQLQVLNKNFLSTESEENKKKILEEFNLKKSSNLNFIYYADLMLYDIQKKRDIELLEKLSLYIFYYIGCEDMLITEKVRAEIKTTDSGQLLGEIGLEFIYLMKINQDKKAYDYLLKQYSKLKAIDLSNIYSFAMHKRDKGDIKKAIEILTFTFKEDTFAKIEKTNEEANKIAKAFKRANLELTQCKNELQVIELVELPKFQNKED